MSHVNLKPIQLDDDTIIYVQVNDANTATDIAQTVDPENKPDPSASSPEPDLELPDPVRSATPHLDNSDDDQEVSEPTRSAKGWKSSQQIHVTETPPAQTQPNSPKPTPAKRVGTLVKAYTQHLVKDIRTTSLTDVEIEKVTLEFGVSLDTELNTYIASSALECSVKVAIECKLSPPQASQNTSSSSQS